jgi:hypothetical protein
MRWSPRWIGRSVMTLAGLVALAGCTGTTRTDTDGSAGQSGGGGGAGGSPGADGGMVCVGTPRPGCCFVDGDCGPIRCVGTVCTPAGVQTDGVCEPILPPNSGQCWVDSDCPGAGQACVGAQICPCGSACLVQDQPGRCN